MLKIRTFLLKARGRHCRILRRREEYTARGEEGHKPWKTELGKTLQTSHSFNSGLKKKLQSQLIVKKLDKKCLFKFTSFNVYLTRMV